MSCEKIKITDGSFSVEKFIDVDTRRSHDIIIYRYAINGDLGHNMVIGECFTNEENIIPYLQKLMKFRITHASMPFIYGTVKFMKDFNIFDLILLSKDGYNLLFNPELYNDKIENIITNNPKTIVIDPQTKRFSSVSNDIRPFNSIEYYDEKLELEKEQKVLKKAVNY